VSAAPPIAGIETLSIAIVDAEGHLSSMQKSILRGAGVRKVGVVDSVSALYKDIIFGRDLVVINWTAADDRFTDIVRAVRHKEFSPDPFLGVVVVASCPVGARVRAALEAGATSFVKLPFRPIDVLRHVVNAGAAPDNFLDAPGYFGPDRRRRVDPFYLGPERRKQRWPLLTGDDLAKRRERMRNTARSALEMKVSMMG